MDVSINCSSEYPVTWKPFKGFTGVYHLTHVQTGDGIYVSTIHLINITHHYVGYFFCVSTSTQLAYDYSLNFVLKRIFDREDYGVTEIYVFVNDDNNRLVPVVPQEGQTVFENDHLVIQCKPTTYDKKVYLFQETIEISPQIHEYNPTVGFVIRFIDVAEIYGMQFRCSTDPDNQSDSDAILFDVTYHVPDVQSATGLYGTDGEQLSLNCTIDILRNEKVNINWTLPVNSTSLEENRVNVSEQTLIDHPTRSDLQIAVSEIRIENVNVNDTGDYKCEVIDHLMNHNNDEILIEILKKDDNSVQIYTPNGVYRKEISLLRMEAIWQVKYRGNPKPTLEWYDNVNKMIERSDKYEVTITNDFIILMIKALEVEDSGNYTLKAFNAHNSTAERKFELLVKTPPLVQYVDEYLTAKEGDVVKIICNSTGYPLPKISWNIRTCTASPYWPNCNKGFSTIKGEYNYTTKLTYSSQTSVLHLNASDAGFIECVVVNSQGKHKAGGFLEVTDMDTPFNIWGSDDKIFIGDEASLTCAASVYSYLGIQWYRDMDVMESNDDLEVERCDTKYSHRMKITWNSINTSNSDTYQCEAVSTYGDEPSLEIQTWNISVLVPKRPEIVETNVAEHEIEVLLDEPIGLHCKIIGFPIPTLEWYKNGKLMKNDDARIRFSDNLDTLFVQKSRMDDQGEYKCSGKNRFGLAEKLTYLRIRDLSAFGYTSSHIFGVVMVLVVIACIVCIFYLYARFRRERRLRRELNATVITSFDEGIPNGLALRKM